MTTSTQADHSELTPQSLFDAVTHISESSQALMQDFLAKQHGQFDTMGLQQAYMELGAALIKHPEKIATAQLQAWNAWVNLCLDTAGKVMGVESKADSSKPRPDKRFKHEAWENNPFFDHIKQSYLLAAGTIQSIVNNVEGLDAKTAHKIGFYTRQFIDAMSPSNFMLTNPEVIENTLQTNGQNLLKGLQNFCKDFDMESGQLRIRMTDRNAFELGKNIAVSPGKVIFQNELMQLIQYDPATNEVYKKPVLIIPPWINKFYILDLQPRNSLIKWLTEQGHTVFVISWVNPDASLSQKDFEDYIFDGPLAALDAIEQAIGVNEVNVIGYCIGGTLLSATLAYMQAKQDRRIVSATFLVTLIDFTDPGDLGVFIDEQQIQSLEQQMNERGYHEGREMATAFNLLRANDLIWSFYVNNYLLGKDPAVFDLLYWNSDSTRMPARMHSTYLRTMYQQNRFKDSGGLVVRGVPIDVRTIQTPAYFISTEEDHIAPWKSTYLGAGLFAGPVRFVLGKSGHIAGVVNHPDANKYGYFTGLAPEVSAEQWYGARESHHGSWWPDWNNWVAPFVGEKVAARQPGAGKLKALEAAPGSYVRVES